MRSAFLAACRNETAPHVPVWFMRQAGRSLPEYRAVRRRHAMLDIVADAELTAEVTLQPVRRYGVDAAILFSDIVVPLAAIGLGVRFEAGTGPVVDEPFRVGSDLRRMRPLEPEVDIPSVIEAVRLLVKELAVPLIGFAGGPFTLASYLIEGGPSKTHARTKALMFGSPATWHALVNALAGIALASLRAQVEAGAEAVQVFDSWVGELAPDDYRRFVLPATRRIFTGLEDLAVPRIYFGVGTGMLLELLAQSGADVVGIDWRTPLDRARQRLGPDVAVQGNLDPARCLAGPEAAVAGARDVLAQNRSLPGHIFNLGWGVHPDTDPATPQRLVEVVHGG